MANGGLVLLTGAWSRIATALTSEMRRLENWPSAGLRQSRLERARDERDSIFVHQDTLKSITPKLAAEIRKTDSGLLVQPLFDFEMAANDGIKTLLSSHPSPSMSHVERAFLAASQFVDMVRELAIDNEIGTRATARETKPGKGRGRPEKKWDPKMEGAVKEWLSWQGTKSSMEDFVRDRFATPGIGGLQRKTEEFRTAVRTVQRRTQARNPTAIARK